MFHVCARNRENETPPSSAQRWEIGVLWSSVVKPSEQTAVKYSGDDQVLGCALLWKLRHFGDSQREICRPTPGQGLCLWFSYCSKWKRGL